MMKYFWKLAALCICMAMLAACGASSDDPSASESDAASVPADAKEHQAEDVVLGDEQFDEYLPFLEGKRVALFSNHTGIVGDETSDAGETTVDTHFGFDADGEEIEYGEHILDALLSRGVNVTAIFSPEHGFRGTADAGYLVEAYRAYRSTGREESFWGAAGKDGHYWIDLISGSDALRTMIEEGKTVEEIKASWQEDIELFKTQRAPYLLYEE